MTMQLFALDGLAQIAQIFDYSRVEAVERDLNTGAWLMELPAGSLAGQLLAGATFPGIEIWDRDNQWRYGGYVTDIDTTETETRDTVTFRGNDFQTELQNRIELPNFADFNDMWTIVYGGTIPRTTDARNTVALNCSTSAIAIRQIPNLVFVADPAAGIPLARRLKGLPLLQVMRELFTGEDYTARLFLFRDTVSASVAVNYLVFDTPFRITSNTVRISTQAANIGSVTVTDTMDRASHVIAMGDEIPGSEPARYVRSALGSFADWRERYVERYITRPGTDDPAALVDEANAHLVTEKRGITVKADGIEVDGYGRTVNIGWKVRVSVGAAFDAAFVEVPVVASKLTFDTGNGWRRTIDVGAENLQGPAAVYDQIAALATRVKTIETEN